MLRLIRAHGVLLRLAAEYSAAMCGVCPGTLVTWPWLRLSMIYCCALRPLSQICVTCQSCWFLGLVALSCRAGASCFMPVGWRHMYEMDMEHFADQNLSVRSEEHTSELQSLREISYAVFCLKKKNRGKGEKNGKSTLSHVLEGRG